MQFMFQIFLQNSAFSNSKGQSYIVDVIAVSPSVDLAGPMPVVPQLQGVPRALPLRVAAMFRVLVRLFNLNSL